MAKIAQTLEIGQHQQTISMQTCAESKHFYFSPKTVLARVSRRNIEIADFSYSFVQRQLFASFACNCHDINGRFVQLHFVIGRVNAAIKVIVRSNSRQIGAFNRTENERNFITFKNVKNFLIYENERHHTNK